MSGADQPSLLYFDYAATAPMRESVREAVRDVWERTPGNPSSLHGLGREARHRMAQARRDFAELLGVDRDDLVFTGNGSEANVLAIAGVVGALPPGKRHVISTPIEHPCVLDTLRRLAEDGQIQLTMAAVDPVGRVDVAEIDQLARPDTGLLSVMAANNELGTLQPVDDLQDLATRRGFLFHTDACQTLGKTPFPMRVVPDLFTFSPHKYGGPRGIGVLCRRPAIDLRSPFSVGRQEQGLRGGTEDVASVVGAAVGLREAMQELEPEAQRLSRLQLQLIESLSSCFPEIVLHSPRENVLPGVVNFSLLGIPGSWLVTSLDRHGVAVSHGSACASLAALPSHVLEAVGAEQFAKTSVRISMGRGISNSDVEELVLRLGKAVVEIRKI